MNCYLNAAPSSLQCLSDSLYRSCLESGLALPPLSPLQVGSLSTWVSLAWPCTPTYPLSLSAAAESYIFATSPGKWTRSLACQGVWNQYVTVPTHPLHLCVLPPLLQHPDGVVPVCASAPPPRQCCFCQLF